MIPHGLSARRLAAEIDVAPNRVTEIIRGRRDVSADTAAHSTWASLSLIGSRRLSLAQGRTGQKAHFSSP